MRTPLTTTTMATPGDTSDVSMSYVSVSVIGRVAALLGTEENAIRILLSLLLGLFSAASGFVYLRDY